MLQFSGLSKRYRTSREPALLGFDLEVRDGEIVGLVGLNGAGKTSAIRIASGVTLPSGGTVRVDGHDIVGEKRLASARLGWVPEFPNFEPQGRAQELLEYFAGYYALEPGKTSEWIQFLLKQVGLSGREHDRVGTYSQGMKKRFALAAALIHRPKNLLLDELLNGLDPEGIRFARHLILSLRSQGCAVLLSSHILTEVEQLADRIAFVHKGKLLRILPHQDLERAPGARLRVQVTHPAEGVLEYLRTVGPTTWEGRSYVVSSPQVGPHQVNRELLQRGFEVAELHTEREDLESYFFRLIEEAG